MKIDYLKYGYIQIKIILKVRDQILSLKELATNHCVCFKVSIIFVLVSFTGYLWFDLFLLFLLRKLALLGEKGEDLVLEVPLGITVEHQNKIIGRCLKLSNGALKLISSWSFTASQIEISSLHTWTMFSVG